MQCDWKKAKVQVDPVTGFVALSDIWLIYSNFNQKKKYI